MSKHHKKIWGNANEMLYNYSQSWARFRRFVFAPYLITFTISVVIGNSYGSAIRDMVSFLGGVFAFLQQWLFQPGHVANFDLILTPLNGFISSCITLVAIALSVYYTILLINRLLIKDDDERWGYDQYHEDMKVLQAELRKNNEIAEKNLVVQEKILARLEESKN